MARGAPGLTRDSSIVGLLPGALAEPHGSEKNDAFPGSFCTLFFIPT